MICQETFNRVQTVIILACTRVLYNITYVDHQTKRNLKITPHVRATQAIVRNVSQDIAKMLLTDIIKRFLVI